MIIITIVKDDPNGLLKTFQSITNAVKTGLIVDKWLVKTSSPTDTSLANLDKLPAYAELIDREDCGIYDAMNQAVLALYAEDPRLWTCLLNAGDRLHVDFATWYMQRGAIDEEKYDLLIGSALTDEGAVIEPIAPIIGRGGLNFCHQAGLFRLDTLQRFPFPTQFPIAGDYAHFLSLTDISYKIISATVCVYDMSGLSERSIFSTRVDNFQAGYEARGYSELVAIALMLCFRVLRKVQRASQTIGLSKKPPFK